jgi:FkbM family methyltransferase
MLKLADVLQRLLKRLRIWPPLNRPITTFVRWAIRLARHVPEETLIGRLPRSGRFSEVLPNGSRLHLDSRGDEWVSNHVFWLGVFSFERDTSRIFYELATRARVTFDVGAHIGYYTILAALANPAARVYGFEPHPLVFGRLQQNVALNRVANVSCVRAALADTSGRRDLFHVPFDSPYVPSSSSLSQEFMASVVEHLTTTAVEVTTGDEFAVDHGISGLDLVKIDTETTEPEVLLGMRNLLERDRPAIICEVLADAPAAQIEQLLRPLGYEFVLLTESGPETRLSVGPIQGKANYLFRPR